MRIIFSLLAEKQFKKLPKIAQLLIAKRVRRLKDGYFVGLIQIKGYKNIFRIRIGDYRVVFKKDSKKIFVINLGHRKNVYKTLKTLLK